jgi:hypothetical protein
VTINKRKLRQIAQSLRIVISEEQEQIILERFGTEPWPHVWTEQDIFMQLLKICGLGSCHKGA